MRDAQRQHYLLVPIHTSTTCSALAATARFVSCEQILSTAELVAQNPCAGTAAEPDDGRRRRARTPKRGALHVVRPRLRARRGVPEGVRRGCRGSCGMGKSSPSASCPVRARPTLAAGRGQRRYAARSRRERAVDPCADVLHAVACADLFADDGEILASPMGTVPLIGARLARLTFSPDLLLSDGEALLFAEVPAVGKSAPIEGWIPYRKVFDVVAAGTRHVVMGATQPRPLRQPRTSPAIGAVDAKPTRQMHGVAGCAGQHDQPPHQLLGAEAYSSRVFVDHWSTWSPASVTHARKRPAVPRRPLPRRAPGGQRTSRYFDFGGARSHNAVWCRCTPASPSSRSSAATSSSFEIHAAGERRHEHPRPLDR